MTVQTRITHVSLILKQVCGYKSSNAFLYVIDISLCFSPIRKWKLTEEVCHGNFPTHKVYVVKQNK